MARLRENKQRLQAWLLSDAWQEHIPAIVHMDARESTGPLLSFLLLGETMTHRAAYALGGSVAHLATQEPEAARNILRRLMWHMNEESGNIGWGIPEAFAEVLAHSPRMAEEFHSIVFSYIMDTGRDDNFCDYAPLRRSCYWAVGRVAAVYPHYSAKVFPWLVAGLKDSDVACRGMAAWAMCAFEHRTSAYATLQTLTQETTPCGIFENFTFSYVSVGALAKRALAHANI